MAGFATHDELLSECANGKKFTAVWSKNNSTGPAVSTWYSLWPVGGVPQAGSFAGAALDFIQTNDTTAGAIHCNGNVSAETKHLISAMVQATGGSTPPTLMLVDMVGYYTFLQNAASQNFTNGTPPNRYNANGQGGLQMCMVASAVGDATASTIDILTYVDQDGNAGVVPVLPTLPTTVSCAAPTTTLGARVCNFAIGSPFLPLAAGDCGVQQCTNIDCSAAVNGGNKTLMLVRPICIIPCPTVQIGSQRDFVLQISNMERIYDGACLTFLVYFASGTASNFFGTLDFAWS